MATTPRPYLWKSCTKRAENVEGVGGIAHYFTEDAQSFYLHNGIAAKNLYVDDGHWEDAVAGEEIGFETNHFTQMSLTHPATGSWYASVILPYENDQGVYLVRYTYARDMGHLVTNAKWDMQVDNPISQLSASLKNYDSDAFTKSASLYVPGARVELGLTMGDSEVYMLGKVHLDEIDFKYNNNSVSISGRNTTGYVLNDSTFNAKGSKSGTVFSVTKWILDLFGIENYSIQENNTEFEIEYEANTTGLRALQDICDRVSGFENGTDWGIEELWDGTIVIGFNSFRANYLPKQVFKFGKSELFKRSSNKVIDGAYSKIYCAGKDKNGNDLTPVCLNVTTWKWWNVVPNKTYFAPVLENTTQAELQRYAQVMVKQIKRTGLNESYSSPIKPQLLVGDYATVVEDETETDIGIITQVTHSMGEKGYTTEFVADSGGDKQSLITRSVSSSEAVYTSARRNSGDNRTKRLIDFIKNTAQQVVRTSPSPASTGGVKDVEVDGTSVVDAQGVAQITMPTIPVVDVEVDGTSVVNGNGVAELSTPASDDIEYDNTTSGLTATNVQDAIDEIAQGGGGGGSSTFAGLDDVSFNNIQNGQVPKYNSNTQKWENADESGGGGTVTDVEVDGVSVVNQQGVAEIPAIPTVNVDDVEVNGASVVNANKVAEIKSYKEVTFAEYQALPSSKTSDGVMYCIKDIGGANQFPPLIYSDEEREVGVWRDGKPLYQKTYDAGSIGIGSTKVIDISSLNIDYVACIAGCGYSSQYNQSLPLPFVHSQSIYSISVNTTASNSVQNANLQIATGSSVSLSKSSITLYYTKSTDTAGSGTWATSGGFAHHYSETEQVIGTWVNGKPLYEISYIVQSQISLNSNTWTTILSSVEPISSIDTLVDVNILGNKILIPFSFRKNNSNIDCYVITVSDNIRQNDVIILQYTKTTD